MPLLCDFTNNRRNLADSMEEYKYSSARFYETGVDEWGFLTHYAG